MKQKWNIKTIALIGVLGGLAAVLMMFRFPLPFMPPFMDFDLSGLPEMIGGFTLGPIASILIILVKNLVKLALSGTGSMFTGELQNIILSCAYVIPAVLIYDHTKTKKSAIQGMFVGTIVCAMVAVVTNLTIIIPFYVNLFGYTMTDIIAMCAKVSPLMKDTTTLVLFGIIPFNLIKNGVVSVLTYVLYKRVSSKIKNFVK